MTELAFQFQPFIVNMIGPRWTGPWISTWGTPEIPPGCKSEHCGTSVLCLSPGLQYTCICGYVLVPTEKKKLEKLLDNYNFY